MLNIQTNLKISDYENLKFDNFRSKSLKKIEETREKEVQKIKKQNIEIKINNNNYSGKIFSYPIVSNIHPTNYKCEWWDYNINATFKIIVEVRLGDINTIEKLINEEIIYIDNIKYYIGVPKIKKDTVYLTYIAFESIKKPNHIVIE